MVNRVSNHRRVILFGRYPVPGQTKTRLIPSLGDLGAADLQRRFTEQILEAVLRAGLIDTTVEFCYTGGTRSQVQKWLGAQPIAFDEQSGHGLGERMRNSLFRALDLGCGQALLIGTDIPQLDADHIKAAFEALAENDVVLGPSRDGGYWLVGMKRKIDIFQNIDWSTSQVLDQTLDAVRKKGFSAAKLSILNDMDTEADLEGDLRSKEWKAPYLSVVIPALNEAGSIESTIKKVSAGDNEVIVADGGSDDNTVKIARATGVKVISSQRGRAIQQNAGARKAQGRVLLFLHADTLIPANFGHQIFETLMDHRVKCGAFRFKSDYDHRVMRLIEKTVHIRSTLFQMPYGDQALFLTRDVFEQLGGFPLVPIAEDLYLVRKISKIGRIALAPGFAVTSGRRWRNIGIWRATLVNYIIALGCILGIDPHQLAPLYRWWGQDKS